MGHHQLVRTSTGPFIERLVMSFVHLDGVSYITRDTTFFVTFFFGYGGVGYRYYNGLRALGAHLGNPELIHASKGGSGWSGNGQTDKK